MSSLGLPVTPVTQGTAANSAAAAAPPPQQQQQQQYAVSIDISGSRLTPQQQLSTPMNLSQRDSSDPLARCPLEWRPILELVPWDESNGYHHRRFS